MKLISEQLQDVEFIKEEKENGKKDYKIKGIFMQADIKNRNGRVYPMDVLEKEVKRYNEEYVDKKRAFGRYIMRRGRATIDAFKKQYVRLV